MALSNTDKKKRISGWKYITFILWVIIVGLVGVSLPETINFINGLDETAFYGYFASYMVSVMLFWIIMGDFSFLVIRESYVKKLSMFVKKCMFVKRQKGGKT